MSGWFDKLLEELQRRQAEEDARREGRPIERNVTPIEEGRRADRRRGSNGGNGHGGGPPVARPIFGSDMPWRRWAFIGGGIVVAVIVLGLLGGAINLITDVMWYDALDRRDVLQTRLWAQIALFAIGFTAMLVPVLVSVWLARRIVPQAPVRRLGGWELPDVSRLIGLALVGIAVLLALGSGAAWSGAWETILLFFNGEAWGTTDPTLGRDIGFYVFDLPFWRFVLGWASTALIIVGILTLAAYGARALRWQFHLSAPVRAHLSVIGALLLVVIAAGYQLDIAELAYSTRGWDGNVQAALYTDMNAQYPAYEILTVVALVSAGLLLLNTWFRTLWLLGLAAGAWFLLSIVVGGLYPAFVQRVQVEPNELTVELPYIRNHLEATRDAFDLDAIETRPFTGEQELSREVFSEDQPTIDNLRLWDYRPLLTTFGQQQNLRRYYRFADVDIDRYQIQDEQREIMLSARELDVELFGPNRTWTQEKLVYTHGYGITAVPVDAVTPAGTPDYLVSGINREPQLPITEPRIYFGEETDTYVVTSTTTAEFDYPLDTDASGEAGTNTVWDGTTGVDIGNPISRLLFALRFGDFNLLISGQLTDDSQILFRRDIEERVREIAPFLALRPRSLSRQRRGPPRLGLGRLHRHRSLPERAATRRGQPLRRGELRAQQRQGRRGRVQRDGAPVPGRSRRADRRRLRPDLPRPLRAARRDAGGASGPPPLSRGPVRGPEPGLPALPPARDRRRGVDVLQPGRPMGDPRGRDRRRRSADGAVLRDHARPRRGRSGVRADPADGAGRTAEHDRLGRGPHGSGRVRREDRLPVPDRHHHPGTGPDRGAHQRRRRDQRAVHALVERRVAGRARQPARPSDRRGRAALRRADLPPGPGRAVPRVRPRDHGRPESGRLRRDRRGGPGAAARRSRATAARGARSRRRRRASHPSHHPRRPRASCHPTSTVSSRRRSACTPRRRTRWRTATSARTRSESTSWPRCSMPSPRSAIPSGRPRPRIRGARARAGLAAGTRRGGAARSNGPGQRRHAWPSARTSTWTPPIPGRSPGTRRASATTSSSSVPRRRWRPGWPTSSAGTRIPAFGPTRAAARLESSKAFAKRQMERAGVATAAESRSPIRTPPPRTFARSIDRPS